MNAIQSTCEFSGSPASRAFALELVPGGLLTNTNIRIETQRIFGKVTAFGLLPRETWLPSIARREFIRTLRSSFSGTTCNHWNRDAPIAIDQIQRLLERPPETPQEVIQQSGLALIGAV
jgi:hypothetical protein